MSNFYFYITRTPHLVQLDWFQPKLEVLFSLSAGTLPTSTAAPDNSDDCSCRSELAEPAREALRAASVEGETFTAEMVAQVLGVSEREVVRQLGKLDREHRVVSAQGIRRSVLASGPMARTGAT